MYSKTVELLCLILCLLLCCWDIALHAGQGTLWIVFQPIVRDFFPPLPRVYEWEGEKRDSGSAWKAFMGSCDVVWICMILLKAIPQNTLGAKCTQGRCSAVLTSLPLEMLFPHVWGSSWITSFVEEPLAQLEVFVCCLGGLERCWYRKWCLPRETRLGSEIHSDFSLSCSETFLRKMCKTSCCSRCSLSLWRSQRWGSGGYRLCIRSLVFACMALTWMAWLKGLLWLAEVLFVEASGTCKSCSKINKYYR